MKNPIAKDLKQNKLYHTRVVKAKKGKGSYTRKGKSEKLPEGFYLIVVME